MATRTWKGDRSAVAQVDKFTPANVEVDDIFTLTVSLNPNIGTNKKRKMHANPILFIPYPQ